MIRRTLQAGMLISVFLLPAAPAGAGGGGTCHEPTDPAEGDVVAMAMSCFTPGTLWTEPGTTVRFVNKDSYEHTVTGTAGWGTGTEPLAEGEDIQVTFDEAGVYPYTCIFHPGMNGAIVVGDGKGAGDLATTEPAEPEVEPADEAPPVEIPDVPPVDTESATDGVLPWSAAILGASVLTGGLGFSIGRRRRNGDN